MLCGDLNGKEIQKWGKIYTYTYNWSLHCTAELIQHCKYTAIKINLRKEVYASEKKGGLSEFLHFEWVDFSISCDSYYPFSPWAFRATAL